MKTLLFRSPVETLHVIWRPEPRSLVDPALLATPPGPPGMGVRLGRPSQMVDINMVTVIKDKVS